MFINSLYLIILFFEIQRVASKGAYKLTGDEKWLPAKEENSPLDVPHGKFTAKFQISRAAVAAGSLARETLVTVANGLLYNAPVTLGNGQKFMVDLDTGSSDTWFRGPACTNPANDGSCEGTKVDITDSGLTKNIGKTWETTYGIGSVRGEIYTGKVTLAGMSSTIPVGVSTFEEGAGGTDGIFGLGFDTRTSSNISAAVGQSASWYDGLGFKGVQNVFGFAFDKDSNGEVTFGGIDTSKFNGTPVYFPLLSEQTRGYIGWFFDISSASVSVKGGSSPLSSMPFGNRISIGLSDTGTSGILLPTDVARAINQAVGARADNAIPCSAARTAPDVIFRMGGSEFAIPAGVYVYQQVSGACQSQFLPGAEITGTVIFGATFIQSYYAIFDKESPRLGFASYINGPRITLSPGSAVGVKILGFPFLVTGILSFLLI